MNYVTDNPIKIITEDDLFNGLSPDGKFSHLKIILSRNGIGQLNDKYLMVTPEGFGKVKLLDVDFDGHHVQLDMEDCKTGFRKLFSIDVKDESFHFVLIQWNDILKMCSDH